MAIGHWGGWENFKTERKERKIKDKDNVDSSKEEIDLISLDSDDDKGVTSQRLPNKSQNSEKTSETNKQKNPRGKET